MVFRWICEYVIIHHLYIVSSLQRQDEILLHIFTEKSDFFKYLFTLKFQIKFTLKHNITIDCT